MENIILYSDVTGTKSIVLDVVRDILKSEDEFSYEGNMDAPEWIAAGSSMSGKQYNMNIGNPVVEIVSVVRSLNREWL